MHTMDRDQGVLGPGPVHVPVQGPGAGGVSYHPCRSGASTLQRFGYGGYPPEQRPMNPMGTLPPRYQGYPAYQHPDQAYLHQDVAVAYPDVAREATDMCAKSGYYGYKSVTPVGHSSPAGNPYPVGYATVNKPRTTQDGYSTVRGTRLEIQDQEDDEDGFKPSKSSGFGSRFSSPPAAHNAQHLVVNTSSSGMPRTTVYRGTPPEYEDRDRDRDRSAQTNGTAPGQGMTNNGAMDSGTCYFSPTSTGGAVPDGTTVAGVDTLAGSGGGGSSRGRSPRGSLSMAAPCGPKWCRARILGILGVTMMLGLAAIAAVILHAEYFADLPGASSIEELPDPCRSKTCPPGARCVPSRSGGGGVLSASCQCPICPDYGDHDESGVVCGSDLQEYRGSCHLNREACLQGKELSVKYRGPCDPCAQTDCPEPEVCLVSEDRQPECHCREVCSKEFSPVCGSDGRTYSSHCSLRMESCRSRRELRIVYRGRCSSGENPCSGLECSHGQSCNVGRDGVARCECQKECEPVVRPVCGSDGRTYDSSCDLFREACMSRVNVSVAYVGACGINGPCSTHICTHGAECVAKDGSPRCICPECPVNYDPVCGSDGVSYGNECRLRLQACQLRKDLHLSHRGLCSCVKKACGPHATCVADSTGEGQCVCPECDEESDQDTNSVCGSDGKTYPSECALRRAGCNQGKNIVIVPPGECDPCLGMSCPEGTHCVEGTCECSADCSLGTEPGIPGAAPVREAVCGSDHVTYPSECHLKRAACMHGTEIKVIFVGDCREQFGDQHSTLSPLNAVHSAKMSELPKGAAKKDTQGGPNTVIGAAEACKDIRCDFEATCELGADSYPRCSCLFDCSAPHWGALAEQGPVCASDQRMYPSLCDMKKEGCQRQEELRLRPMELCTGLEVKPCGGKAEPLKDSGTGMELNCGAGLHRQDCPRGSYCQQTPHFARCCPTSGTNLLQMSCEDSWYGCCPDKRTLAQGPDGEGCPKLCGCNRLGAVSDVCDSETNTCICKPGVGGEKCDRCDPGYWGLQKVRDHGNPSRGCQPCGCHPHGAVRHDCEQMTGRCVCIPGVQGEKCEQCATPGSILGPSGCVPYAGGGGGPATERPLKRSTLHRSTEPGVGSGVSYKSTRHLGLSAPPPLDPRYGQHRYYYSAGNRTAEPDVVEESADSREVDVHSLSSTSELMEAGINNGSLPELDAPPGWLGTPTPPPAAPPALLGDMCTSSADCGVAHSHCLHGLCACIAQAPVLSRNYCPTPASTAAPRPTSACSTSPCGRGAVCLEGSADSYTCICDGEPCDPDNSTVKGLSFSSRSWLKLSRLEASNTLSIDVEFQSFSPDGILLYSQQHEDGSGDFVSLALVGGYVEFRYNLGSGAVVLRSLTRLSLHNSHRVSAKRYHRDGVLTVDDSVDVTGQSLGSLRALDLGSVAWLGGVPTNHSRIWENIGTSAGFAGCIRRMMLGQRRVDIQDAAATKGLGQCGVDPCSAQPCRHGGVCHSFGGASFKCECSLNFTGLLCESPLNPCQVSPCSGGSTCEPLSGGGFLCRCVPGRRGKTCQLPEDFDSEPLVPSLDGQSYITLPRLEGVGRAFSLEMWFLTRSLDGVLLYDGQVLNAAGRGDFIALNLQGGHVHFRFDLGSGPARIISEEAVELGVWHSVRVSRTDRAGTLQLNNGTIAHGLSGAPLNELNVELPLYVGGVPLSVEVNPEAGVTTGLIGAIQRLVVNGHTYPSLGEDLPRYRGPPCEPAPSNTTLDSFGTDANADAAGTSTGADPSCFHGGLCLPLLNHFACVCQPGFSGQRCEQRELMANSTSIPTSRAIKFSGNTFLHFRGPRPSHHSANFSLTTFSGNGSSEVVEGVEASYEDPSGEEELEELEEGATEGAVDEHDSEILEEDEELEDYATDWRRGRRISRFSLVFRTTSQQGLLLWAGRGKTLLGDYLSVSIVAGYPQLSFNLGSQKGLLVIQSKVQVSDGRWHTLHVVRRKRLGQIKVDNEVPVKGYSDPKATLLNTGLGLWIGGCPSLPSGLPAAYYKGFHGCVRSVTVGGVNLDLTAATRPHHRPHQGRRRSPEYCHHSTEQ